MEGISQSEKAQGETQTNGVRLSSNYGGVVTQLEKKGTRREEEKQLYSERLCEGSYGQVWLSSLFD